MTKQYKKTTEDMDPINGRQVMYAKDSMERMGDDLTEVIVSYLTFADRVRLECMSRQWRSFIYRKQFDLEIKGRLEDIDTLNQLVLEISVFTNIIDVIALSSLLKKCPNIRRVTIYRINDLMISGTEFDLIGQHCPHLKTLECYLINFESYILLNFFREYGYRLETVCLRILCTYSNDVLKQFLSFCPNLKKFDFCAHYYKNYIDNMLLVNQDKDIVPKLEEFAIKPNHVLDSHRVDQEIDLWTRWAYKYRLTMKHLTIQLPFSYINDELISCLTVFDRLQTLSLFFNCGDSGLSVEHHIRQLAANCPMLKRLVLGIKGNSLISNKFFDVFTDFWSLEDLSLYLYPKKTLRGTIVCLRHCTRLKQFLIKYPRLTESFFTGIQTVLPNIRILKMFTNEEISDSFAESLSSVKSLESAVIVTPDKKREYYFGKSVDELYKHDNVTFITKDIGYFNIDQYDY